MIDKDSPPGSWQDHAAFMAACSKLKPEMQEYAHQLAKLEAENDAVHAGMAHYREKCGEMEEELAGLRAENERLCALVEKKLENKDGYTIIDFLRVWHDQQKARADKAEARVQELRAERDRLREVGKWLAAEARENWDKGRLSVDLMTAVEAWDCATLEGE